MFSYEKTVHFKYFQTKNIYINILLKINKTHDHEHHNKWEVQNRTNNILSIESHTLQRMSLQTIANCAKCKKLVQQKPELN